MVPYIKQKNLKVKIGQCIIESQGRETLIKNDEDIYELYYERMLTHEMYELWKK